MKGHLKTAHFCVSIKKTWLNKDNVVCKNPRISGLGVKKAAVHGKSQNQF